MNFEVALSRFFVPEDARHLAVNSFRGALGAYLHQEGARYRATFDPHWPDGPSGYRDAPRPFVLRLQDGWLELITFRHRMHAEFVEALQNAHPLELQNTEELLLGLEPEKKENLIRIEFVTPTALKSGGRIISEPVFKTLAQRLAERVRALGSLYQEWPGDADFSRILAHVGEMVACAFEWQSAEPASRRSARSGEVHELRGYVGWAEYSGPTGLFLPLLRVGQYTGVGRNTVWGNGAIRVVENAAPCNG